MVATPHVSPGVFTKIVDLSEYVRTIPSTIGYIPIISERGPDNQLIFTNARDFFIDYGEPDINYVGKDWGSGPYVASSFLEQSDSLYVMRVLPTDAQFSTIFLRTGYQTPDSSAEIETFWTSTAMTNKDAIESIVGADAPNNRYICAFYSIGRGAWYGSNATQTTTFQSNDRFSIRIDRPGKTPFFKSDGSKTTSGGSTVYRFPDGSEYDTNDYDNLSETEILGYTYPEYNYQQKEDQVYEISILQKQTTKTDTNSSGNAIEDLNNSASASSFIPAGSVPDVQEIERFTVSFDPTQLDEGGDTMWVEDVINRNSRFIRCVADADQAKWTNEYDPDYSEPFESVSSKGLALRGGSDGSLLDADGLIDTSEATALLTRAYNGTLPRNTKPENSGVTVDEILDKEVTFFSVVFDGGYPRQAIKNGIKTLCERRGDCVGIIDNYDNSSIDQALTNRAGRAIGAGSYVSTTTTVQFNTYRMAIYEGFSKIFDAFTGRDVWITPVYHMARIIPFNDRVGEIWFAPAGFNRAAISSIKELRYNPNLSQRDRLYLVQLNPLVRFADIGDTVFGQLTSQRRPTALQDLNITRLVLYVQKAIEQFVQFYIFEQNTQEVWDAIQGEVSAFLRVIQGRRGLQSFNVEVGATEYEMKAKRIHVNITLVPTRVVEQIHLNFFIK